jgi:hypothetical protein
MGKKDLFYKVINTSDGGFALCGYTTSVTGVSDDAMFLKLNSSGHQQWVKFYGGSGKERAQDIIQTSDDGFVVVVTRQHPLHSITMLSSFERMQAGLHRGQKDTAQRITMMQILSSFYQTVDLY